MLPKIIRSQRAGDGGADGSTRAGNVLHIGYTPIDGRDMFVVVAAAASHTEHVHRGAVLDGRAATTCTLPIASATVKVLPMVFAARASERVVEPCATGATVMVAVTPPLVAVSDDGLIDVTPVVLAATATTSVVPPV